MDQEDARRQIGPQDGPWIIKDMFGISTCIDCELASGGLCRWHNKPESASFGLFQILPPKRDN